MVTPIANTKSSFLLSDVSSSSILSLVPKVKSIVLRSRLNKNKLKI